MAGVWAASDGAGGPSPSDPLPPDTWHLDETDSSAWSRTGFGSAFQLLRWQRQEIAHVLSEEQFAISSFRWDHMWTGEMGREFVGMPVLRSIATHFYCAFAPGPSDPPGTRYVVRYSPGADRLRSEE